MDPEEYTVSQILDIFTEDGSALVSVEWKTESSNLNVFSTEPLQNFLDSDGVINSALLDFFKAQNQILVWKVREVPDDTRQMDVAFYGYISLHRLPVGRWKALGETTWQVVSDLEPDSDSAALTRTGNLLSGFLLDHADPRIGMNWKDVITGCLGILLNEFTSLFISRCFQTIPAHLQLPPLSTILKTFDICTESRNLFHMFLLVTFITFGRITILSPVHTDPYLAYHCESNAVKLRFRTWISDVGIRLFKHHDWRPNLSVKFTSPNNYILTQHSNTK